MRLFNRISKIVTFLFFFLLLSTSSLTHAINVDVVGSATDTYSYTSPVYTVSCDGHEQSDIVDIDCMWGKCTVRRESLGYYVVRIPRLCADTVCRIIEDGGAGYKIKVDEPSECACNEWRVEKRESGRCWALALYGSSGARCGYSSLFDY